MTSSAGFTNFSASFNWSESCRLRGPAVFKDR
jgi:hypothetical protein